MRDKLPVWTSPLFPGGAILFITDFPEPTVGFIYEVEFNNGKKYIGRKALWHNYSLPPLKGKKRKRKRQRESDWKTYNGSFKDEELKKEIAEGKLFPIKRTILKRCTTNWEMTYYETKYLFEHDCLLSDDYYNSNILGKFYRPKLKDD